MNRLKYFAVAAAIGFCFLTTSAPKANAQVSFGIQVGAEPPCPYGYFDYAPYDCAPYGYYGPEWFTNGVFIGTGPWYHRHDHFRGHIDRRFDPRSGYEGPFPNHGDHPDWDRHHGTVEGFRGRDTYVQHPQGEHGDHGDHRDHNDHGHH